MSHLHHINTVGLPDDADRSQISDMWLWDVGGQTRLYTTTRYDGQIASWNINGLTPQPLAQLDYQGGLTPGRMGGLVMLPNGLAVGGGAANGGLQLYQMTAGGDISTSIPLPGTSGLIGGMQDMVTVTAANGNIAVYGALAGADGIGHLTFNPAASFMNDRIVQDRADTYAGDVSALAHIRTGGQDYLYSASASEHGVNVWVVGANGILTKGPGLGMDEGLWIATPTALTTAKVAGKDYLIVGSAGSNSLSVIQVRSDGSLVVRDHLLDTLDTRFGGVQAVEVVTAGNQTYVISGGADDGISVHVLLPGGQLLAVDVIADTPAMRLANVSDIAARVVGDDIEIYVTSATETGLTKLRFDTGPAGVTLTATDAGETLTGAAGRDLLIGGVGDDRLVGGAGADIIRDGDGSDTLTGGNGADVFVLAYDNAPDTITDFTLGQDRLDLSGWPMVRDKSQLTLTITATGFAVTYGDETLTVISADGQPIDHRDLTTADLIGGSRLPDVILPGFAGPYTAPPDLPNVNEFLGINAKGQGNFSYKTVKIDGQSFRNPDIGPVNGQVIAGNAKRNVIDGGAKRDKLMGERGNDHLTGGKAADRLFGGGGDDRLWGKNGDDMLAGTTGRDRAFGGDGRDWISGGAGRDRLYGGKSDDLMTGGTQADLLEGGKGADRLYGGGGNNDLRGQAGHDRLLAKSGHDKMTGGAGRDVLIGNGGKDKLAGGAGRDKLFGGTGDDRLAGGAQPDRLLGGAGRDLLTGGTGGDQIEGGSGGDTLNGAKGGDRIKGQTGNDSVTGGAGADVILGGDGADQLDGGKGADQIDGGAGGDRITGGSGGDDLRGGTGADVMDGGSGADTLTGGDGADSLRGGDGSDTLQGNAGNDHLWGGQDNDHLTGGAGHDALHGDLGDDHLIGGAGDDLLVGGAGADTFVFHAGADVVQDLVQGQDQIIIDYDAFDGRLVPSEILLLYGTQDAGTVTIDFENGNVLTLQGVTDYATLADSITVI